MKKLLALILTLLCILFAFAGCSLKESTYHPTEVENVSISISNVSSTGATVIIKDTNAKSNCYGEWYAIEKEKDGTWYEVKTVIDDYGFNELGYLTNDEGIVDFNIDWEWLYGKLPTGKYRLLKQVNNQYISVVFEIA